MKTKNFFNGFTILSLLLLFLLWGGVTDVFGKQVDEKEAADVADLWYAMEINTGHIKISNAEKEERLNRIQERKILYMTSKDVLLDSPPGGGQVIAYVIKYLPSGYVVVSGDDRVEPIIVFDVQANFRWDEPERNFLRYFLGKEMPVRTEHVKTKAAMGIIVEDHPNWTKLRSKVQKRENLRDIIFDISLSPAGTEVPANTPGAGMPTAPAGTTFTLLGTADWNQLWPYNTTVVANNDNIANIPTGCVATAIAIKARYHMWPITGTGPHTYNDTVSVPGRGNSNFTHTVDYSAQYYNWGNMPTTDIATANADVADLMYHAGVSVDMNYEIGNSTAVTAAVANAMDNFFRYKGTDIVTANHNQPIIDSIRGELPVVIRAAETNGNNGHALVVDGYRETEAPFFHMNLGWGGDNNGWYHLDGIPGSRTITHSLPYSAPTNYIYVDGIWRLSANGNLQSAYWVISQGISATPVGGHLWIKGGINYPGATATFDKPMTIHSYAGAVSIGGL